jgi:hypothetical protein
MERRDGPETEHILTSRQVNLSCANSGSACIDTETNYIVHSPRRGKQTVGKRTCDRNMALLHLHKASTTI